MIARIRFLKSLLQLRLLCLSEHLREGCLEADNQATFLGGV